MRQSESRELRASDWKGESLIMVILVLSAAGRAQVRLLRRRLAAGMVSDGIFGSVPAEGAFRVVPGHVFAAREGYQWSSA
jgi:hypothetical protein